VTTTGKALGAFVAVGLTVLTAALSQVPLDFSGGDHGILRLSWRNDGVTVEACRERTEEELANLPIHMRNPTACIGEIASYHLRVEVDGSVMVDDTLRPAGARGDGPVYVLEELPMEPGTYQVGVSYDALLQTDIGAPPGIVSLSWTGTFSPGPGDVLLVTLDEDSQVLVSR
jgi:hypothetical protein